MIHILCYTCFLDTQSYCLYVVCHTSRSSSSMFLLFIFEPISVSNTRMSNQHVRTAQHNIAQAAFLVEMCLSMKCNTRYSKHWTVSQGTSHKRHSVTSSDGLANISPDYATHLVDSEKGTDATQLYMEI